MKLYLVSDYDYKPIKICMAFEEAYKEINDNQTVHRIIIPFEVGKNIPENEKYEICNERLYDNKTRKWIDISILTYNINGKKRYIQSPDEAYDIFNLKRNKLQEYKQLDNIQEAWCYLCNKKEKQNNMKKVAFLDKPDSKHFTNMYVCSFDCKIWKYNKQWGYPGSYEFRDDANEWWYKPSGILSKDNTWKHDIALFNSKFKS